MGDARFTDKGNGNWLLEGELGFSTVPAVLAQPQARVKGGGPLVVDLGGVTRADSAGLALLVEWQREAERAGREISFCNVPDQLLSIARLCGLADILSFVSPGTSGKDA